MDFNLIAQAWLPVVRQDGSTGMVAPWGIAGGDPPAVDLAAPRAEFRAALLEFLVGLLQTACPPKDDREWRARLKKPPEPRELRELLALLQPYFNLFSAAPRFLQDAALRPDSPHTFPVRDLLIEDTTGHFAPEGADQAFCPTCAAMALFTLQAFAPAGGRGNMTSLRGGGPLSTLVRGDTLWRTVWANVLPLTEKGVVAATSADLASGGVFPWAGPPIPAHGFTDKTWPEDKHFLHSYWGMPRRLLLLPEETVAPEPCALCAEEGNVLVRRYVSRPDGYDYGDTWRHPLTPYRVQGGNNPTLSVKGSANITGYTHWLGVVYGDPADSRAPLVPAACVRHFRTAQDEPDPAQYPGLGVAGFDMDNMKPRQWCEGRFPLLHVAAEHEDDFRARITAMIQAAEETRKKLMGALKGALFPEGSPAKIDASLFVNAAAIFWASTEGEFYCLAAQCAPDPGLDATLPVRTAWAAKLRATALEVFDGETGRGRFRPEEARRVVNARRILLIGMAKALPKLLALPEAPKPKKRKEAAQ